MPVTESISRGSFGEFMPVTPKHIILLSRVTAHVSGMIYWPQGEAVRTVTPGREAPRPSNRLGVARPVPAVTERAPSPSRPELDTHARLPAVPLGLLLFAHLRLRLVVISYFCWSRLAV